jgi:hypothetical protein
MRKRKAKNSGEGGLPGKGNGKSRLRRKVMESRRAIIRDKKLRGEWVEAGFLARALEEGIPASVPWGERRSYDGVVGWPGDFWAIQVKCTVFRLRSGGYKCCVCTHNRPYPRGAFDFYACYVVPEDVWYIIPEEQLRGMKCVSLCTEDGYGRYEKYREAWHLLKRPKKAQARRKELGGAEGAGVAVGGFAAALRTFVEEVERARAEG